MSGSRNSVFIVVFHIVWHKVAAQGRELLAHGNAHGKRPHLGSLRGKWEDPWMEGATFIYCHGAINRRLSKDSSSVGHKNEGKVFFFFSCIDSESKVFFS